MLDSTKPKLYFPV